MRFSKHKKRIVCRVLNLERCMLGSLIVCSLTTEFIELIEISAVQSFNFKLNDPKSERLMFKFKFSSDLNAITDVDIQS